MAVRSFLHVNGKKFQLFFFFWNLHVILKDKDIMDNNEFSILVTASVFSVVHKIFPAKIQLFISIFTTLLFKTIVSLKNDESFIFVVKKYLKLTSRTFFNTISNWNDDADSFNYFCVVASLIMSVLVSK